MNWLARPWRHIFDYRGRSPRREYWLFAGQFLFGIFLVAALTGLIADATGMPQDVADIPLLLFIIACLPSGLAVAVRRLHDQDKAGWFLFLYFVPFVGPLIFLILMLMPGTDDWNAYGPDPRLGDEQTGQDVAEIFS